MHAIWIHNQGVKLHANSYLYPILVTHGMPMHCPTAEWQAHAKSVRIVYLQGWYEMCNVVLHAISSPYHYLIHLGPELLRNFHVKIHVNWQRFSKRHLIDWQHNHRPIRSQVRKSLLTNMEFNQDFNLVTPIPEVDVTLNEIALKLLQ